MKVESSSPLNALQQEIIRHGKKRADAIITERMRKDTLIAIKSPYTPYKDNNLKSFIDDCGETIRNLGKIAKALKQQDTWGSRREPEFYMDL